MIEEKKTCTNCGATYEVKHDLPEEDYIENFVEKIIAFKDLQTNRGIFRIKDFNLIKK